MWSYYNLLLSLVAFMLYYIETIGKISSKIYLSYTNFTSEETDKQADKKTQIKTHNFSLFNF